MAYVRDNWHAKDKAECPHCKRGNKYGKPRGNHGQRSQWTVMYTPPGTREEKSGGSFTRKTDADRKEAELNGALAQGQRVVTNTRVTVSEHAHTVLTSLPLAEGTRYQQENRLKNHVDAVPLGARRLSDVRPSDAQAWVTDRARRLKPSALQLVTREVKRVFATAVRDRLIPENPFTGVVLPAVQQARIVPLTVDQVRVLAEAIEPHRRAMVITQAGLGLRLGELLGLQESDISWDLQRVRIDRQVHWKDRELRPLKNAEGSRRVVPMPRYVAEALRQHLDTAGARPGDGLLFRQGDEQPILAANYRDGAFARAVRRAGLQDAKGTGENVTPHDLRHHYASVLLYEGCSVVEVAERLGHVTATQVMERYGHLLPGKDDRTRSALDAAWWSTDAV